MSDGISNYAGSSERSKIAMKLAIFAGIEASFFAVLALITGFGTGWSGLGPFTLGAIPFLIAAVFSVAAVFYGILSGNAAEDEYEKELLKKRKENRQSLLDVSEDVRFTSGRTFQNYLKYAPQVFALIGFLIVGIFLWQSVAKVSSLGEAGLPLPKSPMTLAFVCAISAAVALFTGMFLSGQSRIAEFRWLRPAGAWLIAGAFIWLISAIPAVALHYGHQNWELSFGKFVFGILAVLGAEFIFNFVSEFYRPRTQLEDRPVHESRLLALFIDPGSLAKNIANTLDYQFGFKVSGTWMYQKFCQVALPAIFAWLAGLWLFTCIGEVGPGEIGLKTRFGELISEKPLKSGIYLKLPWPCDEIHRIKVEEPRKIVIGVDAKKSEKKGLVPQTILWTKQHEEGEIPFLVANDSASKDLNNAVSLLNAVLPVVYKVDQERILDYFLNYRDVDQALLDLGTHEATVYFASTDFFKDLYTGREEITRALQERIQKRADAWKLGITILNVDLNGTHPPVQDVASAFQDVIIAQEQMHTEEEKALAYATEKEAAADIERIQIISEAQTYKYKVTNVSASEAAEFKSKLSAYNAMPEMFKLRTYLSFLENDCAGLRKYIVSAAIPYQILELNAEEKPRLDLLDADMGGEIN